MMKQYVAGWDGGGTKTAIQIRDLSGNIVHSGQAGALNYNSQSEEDLRYTIKTLVDEMEQVVGTLKAFKSICISTAGVSNGKAVEFISEELIKCGIKCVVSIVGDHESALYGALGKEEGIILISGTGSICFGKNSQGKAFRTGGWGHLIDDEGSGYAIGRDILSAAVRDYDKRSYGTILYDAVLEAIQGNTVKDIIQFTYKSTQSKKNIASLAPLLLPAIEKNDTQAKAICEKAVRELTSLVVVVAKELNLEKGDLAFGGGILKHYKPIYNKVKINLGRKMPYLKLKEALADSVTGATLMALDKAKKM